MWILGVLFGIMDVGNNTHYPYDIDDEETTKPYPEGPYVSFKEGKRRAEVNGWLLQRQR